MLKIGLRYNLLYPLMLVIFTTIRKIDTILMDKIIGFNASLFLSLIMFLSEFLIGLILFMNNYKFLNNDIETNNSFIGIQLIHIKPEMTLADSKIKIYILIFMSAFFDFNIFFIDTYYLPRQFIISNSINIRLRSILTISSSLWCYFLLRIPIFKHHIFSLVIIFICLIIVIITECFFQQNIYVSLYTLAFNLGIYFMNSCLDVTEKYLLEYNFTNPFKMIMVEGMFGFILTVFLSIIANSFNAIILMYNKENGKFELILLFVFLFFYLISSGGRNIYRVLTIKIYSPMTRTLTDCLLDPLLILYYYLDGNDFLYNDKPNIFYFLINIITSLIIVFCSCVYNEIFVLFFCGLEHDTHFQVSKRASVTEILSFSQNSHDGNDNNENSNDENNEQEFSSNKSSNSPSNQSFSDYENNK